MHKSPLHIIGSAQAHSRLLMSVNFIVCLIGDGHMDFKQFKKIHRNLIVTVLNGVHVLFKNKIQKNEKRRLSISQGRRKETGALLDLC